jgi:hypothetical protein
MAPKDGNRGDGLHVTYQPTITEWTHGEVKERLVIPAGEVTDYSSIPEKGVLGWLARKRGFNKKAPYFRRSGGIHDPLYFALKHWGGILPYGWYQFFNPVTSDWEPVIAYQWERKQADTIWKRVSIEDGCPEKIANEGYWWLRKFGGLHMIFN